MRSGGYGRRSGPVWFLALAVVIFVLYSAAVAASTASDCDRFGGGKTWRVMPPGWECTAADGTR